jgi:hypothetical protein
LLFVLAAGVASGDEEAEARAAHWARMKAVAAEFSLLADADRPDSRIVLPDQPVLRYADNTRRTHESGLWAMGEKGRPSAVLVIEYYSDEKHGTRWLYEIASLSSKRIAAQRGDDWKWAARQPGLALTPLPGADLPAARPAQRLAQMKKLRDRFTAHERANIEGRIELRPLASPLFRWEDAAGGILDGAVFSFASGTNPQVLLVLEAQRAEGKARWVYDLVQLTGEPVAAQLDGQEVWKRDAATPPVVRDSYVNGWIGLEPAE